MDVLLLFDRSAMPVLALALLFSSERPEGAAGVDLRAAMRLPLGVVLRACDGVGFVSLWRAVRDA